MSEAHKLKAALKKAIETHVAGRLDEAEKLYAFVLGKAPDQVDASYYLGILLVQRGQREDGLSYLERAHEKDLGRSEVLEAFAHVLISTGRHAQAITVLSRALSAGQKSTVLSKLLATARGRESPAKGVLPDSRVKSRAGAEPEVSGSRDESRIDIGPKPSELDRAVRLFDRKAFDEAEATARKLTSDWPSHNIAWTLLGRIEVERNRPKLAAHILLRSAVLAVDDGVAHFHLGLAQNRTGQPSQAASSLRRAAELRPEYSESWRNLALVLREHGYLEQAAGAFHRAIALNPQLPGSLRALGNIAEIAGRIEHAEAWVSTALRLTEGKREDAEQSCLLMEDFLQRTGRSHAGWRLGHQFATRYDGGCEVKVFLDALRAGARPWVNFDDAKDLARGLLGLNLLAPLVADRMGVACPTRLHGLAARSFPNWEYKEVGARIPAGVPVLSFRSIPCLAMEIRKLWNGAPALLADTARVAMISASLRGRFPGKTLVGLSWRSSLRANPHTLQASSDLRIRELEAEMRPGFDTRLALWRKLIPISHLDVIKDFKNCVFVSVQYNVEPEEVEFMEKRSGLPIHFLSDDFLGPIDDAAALISALDAVVSIPNSHAHLAAALGRPTFVLLHDVPVAIWAAQRCEKLYPDVELCAKPLQREDDGRYLFGYNGDWRPTLRDALDRVCRRDG